MKLGMPTLIEFDRLEENIELCKELELDFIEMNMNIPIFTPESLSVDRIRTLKNKHGVDFTIHLPEEMDLSSFQPSIRQGHLSRCKETIRWASEAGIQLLNMHLNTGIYFTLPNSKVWINERYETEFLQLLLESYKELIGYASYHNVIICTENTRNFHIPFINKGLQQLKELNNFFLTWDVGHDAKGNYKEYPLFQQFSNYVKHMHLHDCHGDNDHLSLYTGSVPIHDRLLFAQRQNLSVVIEVKTSSSLRESVHNIHEKKTV